MIVRVHGVVYSTFGSARLQGLFVAAVPWSSRVEKWPAPARQKRPAILSWRRPSFISLGASIVQATAQKDSDDAIVR